MTNTFILGKMGAMPAALWKKDSLLQGDKERMWVPIQWTTGITQGKKNGWGLNPSGSNEWNGK